MTKILIVEDNADMRRTIKDLLGDLGEVYECSNGLEAFSAYSQHCPDWVLMDIKMAGMNGITATRKIKAAYPDARIVMVTGYDDAELREAARRAGGCGYVLKENLGEVRQMLSAEIREIE
ncbi:MAG: response regulator transcription factor [Acidobacteriota bacterium]